LCNPVNNIITIASLRLEVNKGVTEMISTDWIPEQVNAKTIDCGAIAEKLALYGDAEAHNNLGVAYHVQGQVDPAISEYQKALHINPDLADAHNNLGVAYYAQGNVDWAIKEFREALRIDPGLAQSHYNLGVAYKAVGDIQCAIAEFKEALNIDPNDAATNFSLGQTYQSQGESQKALEFYEEFIKLAPGDDVQYVEAAQDMINRLRKETVLIN
jgi:tetratricopeptide (TPR) repeat protein